MKIKMTKIMKMKKESRNTKNPNLIYSIRTRIMLLLCSCVLISLLIYQQVLVPSFRSSVIKTTENNMLSLTELYNNNIYQSIETINDSMYDISASMDVLLSLKTGDAARLQNVYPLLLGYISQKPECNTIFLTDMDGKIISSSNLDLTNQNIATEEYFQKVVATNEATQSNLSSIEGSDDKVILFAIPIKDNRQSAIGVLVSAIKLPSLTESIANFSIPGLKSSYCYLVDKHGTILYHPTASQVGVKVDNSAILGVVDQISQGIIPKTSVTNYDMKGVTKYASYGVSSINNWTLVLSVDKSDIFSDINKTQSKATLVALLTLVIVSLIGYFIANSIAKPIRRITKLILKTSDLDFTEDISFQKLSKRLDETGEMSKAIEKMRISIHDIIKKINYSAEKINSNAESLNVISNTVNNHAGDNSATAQQLAAGMEETAATTETIDSNLGQIAVASLDIQAKTKEGTNLSDALIERAKLLKLNSSKARDTTQEVFLTMKEKTYLAIEGSKAAQKINGLANTIMSIADQTSLLALNASIEAARAGESGKGFAVVASEIGKLADQSAKTVSNITSIVQEVTDAVSNMSLCLVQILDFLDGSVANDYTNFINVSEQYNQDASAVHITMDKIHDSIDHLAETVDQISSSISNINMTINESNLGVTDIAERNTNIVSLTSETYDMVRDSINYSEGLMEIVQLFKL